MPFKRFQKLEKVQLRSISVSEIFVSFDKCWKTKDEIAIHTLCIKFLLSPKSQVSKIVVLENPAWALASGHVLSLKGNATDFGFLKLLLLLLQALPENRFRGDVLFLCHPPGVLHISATSLCFEGILLLCALRVCTILPEQGAPTCRISLIAAILTNFKQVLALPSKCVGNKNWSTESSPIYIYTLYSQHRLIARLLNILLV